MLGKGFANWSNQYGCLIQCVAGIGRRHGWLRLYPTFVNPIFKTMVPINIFDEIRTVFRRELAEPKPRKESRKILPEKIDKVSSLSEEERSRLLVASTEKGSFLHDDSWTGHKTLGMIKPEINRFFVSTDNNPMVSYYCDNRRCHGHTSELLEMVKTDSMGRTYPQQRIPRDSLESALNLMKDVDLRFVMGTHSSHRHRWIIVATHKIEM